MIYTLTLNPALDYVMRLSDVKNGEVNRSENEYIMAGGKGINVSVVVNRLGGETVALGYIAGFVGEEIKRLLESEKIKTDFVRLPEGNSRINVKLKAKEETEINANGPMIDEKSKEILLEKIDKITENDYMVLSGSSSRGLGKEIYAEIMDRLKKKRVWVVVDAEGDLLRECIKREPFLIKPNHIELGEIIGKDIKNHYDAIEGAKAMQKMGAKNVLVSMAKKGGVLVAENGEIYTADAHKGIVVNSTGAGDSTVAGFLYEHSKSGDLEKAFRVAMASGSATAFSADLATKDEIYELLKDSNLKG